ncbi:hypothetical protein BH11ARM2_BH11ARM2_30600 [soil metagenome]
MTPDPVERYLSRSRRLQGRTVLRPMAGGELLDESLALYRQAALGLLVPLLVPVLVMVVAEKFVTDYVLVRFFETQNQSSLGTQMGEFMTNVALALFAAAPVWIIAISFGSALTVRKVGWTLLGRPFDDTEAARDAQRVLPSLIWASIRIALLSVIGFLISGAFMLGGGVIYGSTSDSSPLAGLVALVGIFGLILGFLWFLFVAGRFGLIAPAAVLEGLRGRVLTKRVIALTKGEGRRSGAAGSVLSLVVTASLLDLLISGSLGTISEAFEIPVHAQEAIGGLLGEAVRGALEMLPGFLSLLLVLPFFTIAITVLYFERRVRVEGYDITALAHDISPDRGSGGVRASG